jgi:hypothetical protein
VEIQKTFQKPVSDVELLPISITETLHINGQRDSPTIESQVLGQFMDVPRQSDRFQSLPLLVLNSLVSFVWPDSLVG